MLVAVVWVTGLPLHPITLNLWIVWFKVHFSACSGAELHVFMPVWAGLQPFSLTSPTFVCDWHFCEFSTSLTFALYTCCVELLALPLPSKAVSERLLLALYEKYVGATASCLVT